MDFDRFGMTSEEKHDFYMNRGEEAIKKLLKKLKEKGVAKEDIKRIFLSSKISTDLMKCFMEADNYEHVSKFVFEDLILVFIGLGHGSLLETIGLLELAKQKIIKESEYYEKYVSGVGEVFKDILGEMGDES